MGTTMDVRDVGVALWRQRPLVLLVLLVTGLAVAAGLLLAPKTYEATATLSVVGAETGTTTGAGTPTADVETLRAGLAELADSGPVVAEVRDRTAVSLGRDRTTEALRGSITGHWVRGTTLVRVTVEDEDPQVAATVANTVATVLADPEVTGADELAVTNRDPAVAPQGWSSPDTRLAVALGLLFAVGLATVAAVARDRRTHTVDDAAGVELAAAAPLLAHLVPPHDLTEMPTLHEGTAEADLFRHVRVVLEQEGGGGAPPTVVAGVADGDVNVWVGANIAIALAATGARVLLVDGRMGAGFGIPVEDAPDTPGLYDVLLGAELDSALSPGPVERLQVLPAGTWGDEPIPELIARRFPEVMAAAAAGFDHVLVLGPPLERSDDSRVMAVDGSLVLTVVEGAVSAAALRIHADRVRTVGARLLGVVLVAGRAERVSA